MGDGPFEDSAKEREFQAAQTAFLHPARVQQKTITLLVTLVAYVAISIGTHATPSWSRLAILIGVLFVHELGHAAGMLAFGYTDVRIFFIPLFGAAAAGRRRGVARWKHGVVLLLGPVPGLVAGIALLAAGVAGVERTVAVMLVLVNGFNLLPVAPFDGGQLFQLLVFSRRRYLELAFLVVAGLALVAGALALHSFVLGLIGYVVLVTLPIRKRLLGAAHELRSLGLPSDPVVLDEPQRRTLFDKLWTWMPAPWHGKPRPQAAAMEGMLEAATLQPVTGGVTAALMTGWLAAAGLAVLGVIALRAAPPLDWQTYHHRDPAFTIELPAAAIDLPKAEVGTVVATRGRDRRYTVTWRQLAPGKAIDAAAVADKLAGSGVVIRNRDASGWDGEIDRLYRVEAGVLHVRTAMTPQRTWFLVTVRTPEHDAEAERVITSFRAGDAGP